MKIFKFGASLTAVAAVMAYVDMLVRGTESHGVHLLVRVLL